MPPTPTEKVPLGISLSFSPYYLLIRSQSMSEEQTYDLELHEANIREREFPKKTYESVDEPRDLLKTWTT
jgi:hypothetical protein